MKFSMPAFAAGCVAFHLAGCAGPSSTGPTLPAKSSEQRAPEQEIGPQVPPGHTLREVVTCHETRVNGVVSSKRNPIRIVNGGVKTPEGTCVEVSADGRLRSVPGQCVWLRSIDGPCK